MAVLLSPRNLASMPPKVLLDVFDHLKVGKRNGVEDLSDIRNLRLFCKSIGVIANALALREFVFSINRFQLRNLLKVAKRHGQHVRSLVYFVEKVGPAGSYVNCNKYERLVRCDPRSMGRIRAAQGPGRTVDDIIIDDWERYTILHQQQKDIIDHQRDCKVLYGAMPQLPNLRHITVAQKNRFRRGTPKRRFIRAGPIYLGFFNGDLFDKPGQELGDFMGLLDNLTRIALTIRGDVRRILDNAPNLEDIDIKFTGSHWHVDHYAAATLNSILPLNRVWPRLKCLSLSHVETERQELARFLKRHKHSLEKFELTSIQLRRTSWKRLLPDLKEKLGDTPYLKRRGVQVESIWEPPTGAEADEDGQGEDDTSEEDTADEGSSDGEPEGEKDDAEEHGSEWGELDEDDDSSDWDYYL
ncbi:hypothetical protein QBC34DRAFT_496994 [Podospora aff. communis PSN243]|uniref:F-box domain-containing protein n=1 Tax=Podospora aff. communis PSN243 TaxID=3040156 RepID=A0AAV9GFW0_9PEZI|nr:hypothetical protein QBC34DRAFT_496994 [Podospora aff. communis PSN243]